ncbi:MAG: hypothetical protein ACTSRP_14490 [Candidatus Helarchaeota archaeon]
MPLIKINDKRIIFGGYFAYYYDKEKKYFIKVCKRRGDLIEKEFYNLKKYWNKLNVNNLNLIKPIKYSKKLEFLVTELIEGKRLVDILNPKIYYNFGKKLKEFHAKGFSHSHLELQDVIYDDKSNIYYICDVPFFNKLPAIYDLIKIKISFNMFRYKKFWNFYRYNVCFNAFLKGYGLDNTKFFENEYRKSLEERIRFLLKGEKFDKIKGLLMKIMDKMGFF